MTRLPLATVDATRVRTVQKEDDGNDIAKKCAREWGIVASHKELQAAKFSRETTLTLL